MFVGLEKFFDTVEPQPLEDSFVEIGFPNVDAVVGFQVHMAPRVILLDTIPSLPIKVDASILAGCIYSVPWVKALFHPGSTCISAQHANYKTSVIDIANVACGYGPDVQDAVVRCALAINNLIVVSANSDQAPEVP